MLPKAMFPNHAVFNVVVPYTTANSATEATDTNAEDLSGEDRFRKVAKSYVEATKKHASNAGIASAAVQFVQKTHEVVSSALAASPPASLAWAGVCLVVLPVRYPEPGLYRIPLLIKPFELRSSSTILNRLRQGKLDSVTLCLVSLGTARLWIC